MTGLTFVLGMAVGYMIWYWTDYKRIRMDRMLRHELHELSLRLDLILEGVESLAGTTEAEVGGEYENTQ